MLNRQRILFYLFFVGGCLLLSYIKYPKPCFTVQGHETLGFKAAPVQPAPPPTTDPTLVTLEPHPIIDGFCRVIAFTILLGALYFAWVFVGGIVTGGEERDGASAN
jgi:hypothetical protein